MTHRIKERLWLGFLVAVLIAVIAAGWALRRQESRYELVMAVEAGDIDAVRTLIERGAPVNAGITSKDAPILHALRRGKWDIARLLLDSGARADLFSEEVHGAMPPRVVPHVLDWLEEDPDPAYLRRFAEAYLPLVIAAGDSASFNRMLAYGPDLSREDWDRRLPIHAAARRNDSEFLRVLLNAGADVRAANSEGETALHGAVEHGMNIENAELLIAAGSDVNAQTRNGATPLHRAVDRGGNNEAVRLLIAHGADVNAATGEVRIAPLHHAAAEGSIEVARILIECGADVNIREWKGRTPLHYAARLKSPAMALMLLEAGADATATDDDGWTPADFAARDGYPETLAVLEAIEGGKTTGENRGQSPINSAPSYQQSNQDHRPQN